MAKKREAGEVRGLKELAERQRKEEEKIRMLREVAELFKTDRPREKQKSSFCS